MKYLVFMFVAFGFGGAFAEDSNDYLLYKLQSKGIITETEAQVIREQKSEETKAAVSSLQSSWMESLNPKGDFRFRYQNDNPIGYGKNRDRVRIRLRGGIEPKITGALKVGIGLATGFNNNNIDEVIEDKDLSRSTNQTLGSGFSKKAVSLDLAYAEYSPVDWLTLVFGKMRNPIWEPGDLIWDTDINPEGVAVKFNKELGSNLKLFAGTDFFVLGEYSSSSDPIMYALQAGVQHKITNKLSYKAALSYYGFSDVRGKRLDGSSLSNTADDDDDLIYDYENVVAALEVGLKDPFNGPWLPYMYLFAEYVNNCNTRVPGANRDGYMVGAGFGSEKLSSLSDWQIKYNYGKLAKDAVLDIFPDSDRYGGKTGIWAHELAFNYALGSSNWLGLDFYYGERTEGSKKPAALLQLDWNIKF